jgi:hypothetical protein
MSVMKINWGTRIAILYGGFVILIVVLVAGSMRQSFDLVAPDYYGQEIKYQQVIDASKNQSALSAPASIYAGAQTVTIDFPAEFIGKEIMGNVQFYSAVNAAWDKVIHINASNNTMVIPRQGLHNANYKIKLTWNSEGKEYYQETDLNLR